MLMVAVAGWRCAFFSTCSAMLHLCCSKWIRSFQPPSDDHPLSCFSPLVLVLNYLQRAFCYPCLEHAADALLVAFHVQKESVRNSLSDPLSGLRVFPPHAIPDHALHGPDLVHRDPMEEVGHLPGTRHADTVSVRQI